MTPAAPPASPLSPPTPTPPGAGGASPGGPAAAPTGLNDLTATGFAKIDRDLTYLVECLREVLEDLGEHDVARHVDAAHAAATQGDPSSPDVPEWTAATQARGDAGAADAHGGDPSPDSPERLGQVYSITFQLLNMVEENAADVTRRAREAAATKKSETGLWPRVLAGLRDEGFSAEEVAALLPHVRVEPVLTAHPTEAKRAAVIEQHRALFRLLEERELTPDVPARQTALRNEIKASLERLWRTGEILLTKPDVASERDNLIFYLREVFPDAVDALDERLRQAWEASGFDPSLLAGPNDFPPRPLRLLGRRRPRRPPRRDGRRDAGDARRAPPQRPGRRRAAARAAGRDAHALGPQAAPAGRPDRGGRAAVGAAPADRRDARPPPRRRAVAAVRHADAGPPAARRRAGPVAALGRPRRGVLRLAPRPARRPAPAAAVARRRAGAAAGAARRRPGHPRRRHLPLPPRRPGRAAEQQVPRRGRQPAHGRRERARRRDVRRLARGAAAGSCSTRSWRSRAPSAATAGASGPSATRCSRRTACSSSTSTGTGRMASGR